MELRNPNRLKALQRTGLLDSVPDEIYQRFVRLAAHLTDSPTALISLVDDRRQFFKASFGLHEPWASRRETGLSHSFCQHVATTGQPLVVEDARQHGLVKDNLAIPDIGVIAYLGVPLIADGEYIGSLCAIDGKPREWSQQQRQALEDLASIVNREIGSRLSRHLSERLSDLMPAIVYVYSKTHQDLIYVNGMGEDYQLQELVQADNGEIQVSSHSGEVRWFMHRRAELDSNLGLWLGLATDTEVSKQTEAGLLEARAVAEAATRSTADFLAMVSHELKTPLQGILGATDLALGDSLNVEQRNELILSAQSCARSVTTIVHQLLQAHQLDRGLLPRESEKFSLAARLGELKVEFLAHRERLIFEGNWNLWWEEDWGKVRQILVNLIGNALKYSKQRPVRVSAAQEGESIRFIVSDQGPGLSEEEMKRIFDPFVRLERTREIGGTGLGLPISRRLAESLGGELTVLSYTGSGSEFCLTLPCQPLAMPPEAEVLGSAQTLPHLEVLVVDDNPIVLNVSRLMLESLGQQVQGAHDGASALASCRDRHFDLVLLDLQLPDTDGLEVALQIRREKTVILGITGDAREEVRHQCLEAGMDGMLCKPFTRAQLAEALLLAAG